MERRVGKVIFSEKVEKQLKRLPIYIKRKLLSWIEAVEWSGIDAVRVRTGYHDKPLQGRRWGQRSVRLNRGYRLFYVERRSVEDEYIEIIEVNKHEY